MSVIFLLFIIVIIIHFIIGRKKLHTIILKIIYHKKLKLLDKRENCENLNTEAKIKNKSKRLGLKKIQKNKKNRNSIKSDVKNNNNKNKQKIGPPPKQKITGNKNIKRSSFVNMYNNSATKLEDISTKKMPKNIGGSVKMFRRVSPRNKILKNKNNKNKLNKNKMSLFKKSLPLSMNFPDPIDSEKKIKINKDNTHNNTILSLNEQELNNLSYEEAISLDKRSYLQYYFSLLKKKHFILFTFYPSNDYNLITMKISLFLLAFSLYFTTDGFFFSDETMHNIYINNGDFDLIYQIPLILYSSVITSVINIILKQLSLSENTILKIKNEENINICILKSISSERRIKIKFIIFYIFSFIFMAFFWYFISCFCAVYKNTQTILIEDSFLSFFLAMLYPLGINLIPGIFRIVALRDPKKGRNCIYSLSKIIALI